MCAIIVRPHVAFLQPSLQQRRVKELYVSHKNSKPGKNLPETSDLAPGQMVLFMPMDVKIYCQSLRVLGTFFILYQAI